MSETQQIISYSTASLRRAITARLSLLESLLQETAKELDSRKTVSLHRETLRKLHSNLENALSTFQQAYSNIDLTPAEYRRISQASIILDAVCCGIITEQETQSLCDKILSLYPSLGAYL